MKNGNVSISPLGEEFELPGEQAFKIEKERLESLVKEMREINPKPLIFFQINHSGRHSQAAFSKVVSPYPTGDPTVHVLTEEEIERIGEQFVKASIIAKQVGADGVDFKHCHGYLGGEMLRPANTRADRFGGSFQMPEN